MFVWARLPDSVNNSHEFINTLLKHAHVFVTPGDIFGTNGKGYLRISLCASDQQYDEAFNRLKLWKEGKEQLVS